jgi:sugar phosphate isomerase/epimerase
MISRGGLNAAGELEVIRSAVTISLVAEARGGPFVFWDDLERSCALAAELGFDGVELFLPAAGAVSTSQLRDVLAATGLKLAAVGTGAGWIVHRLHLCDTDEDRRIAARQFIRSLIDFAGLFGAPAIIGSMQGPPLLAVDDAMACDWLREALDELGHYAGEYAVPVLLEPLNRNETKLVNTLADGMNLLESLTTDNVRLLADFYHMNIEEPDMAAALRRAAPRLGHVHFVDSNREAVGRGQIRFEPLRDALVEIGYDGFLSAEARPLPDSLTAARSTIASFQRLFGRQEPAHKPPT